MIRTPSLCAASARPGRPPAAVAGRALHRALLRAVGALSTGLLLGCGRGDAPAARRDDGLIERVYAACVAEMVKGTCTVMNDKSRLQAAPPGTVVFVAGVGPVDAESYYAIRASGEAMCSQVLNACRSEPEGSPCRTAIGLWGASGRRQPAGR